MKSYKTPAQRLLREAVSLLEGEYITPEHAFAMIRFAADGSNDPEALATLARMYGQGIGCEKNRELAMDLVRRSGKADFLSSPAPDTPLDPWEEDSSTMDDDEVFAKLEEENLLVDGFLESAWTDADARFDHYDTSNLGCSEDHPLVIPAGKDCDEWEERGLEGFLHGYPSRYVSYEVADKKTVVRNGRFIDHIRVRVSTYPLLSTTEDGDLYIPRSRFLGYEDYWFDIQESLPEED